MKPSESAKRLKKMIDHAIADGKVTNLEYDKIMMIADEDGHHDREEVALIKHLQELIAHKTVQRVAE